MKILTFQKLYAYHFWSHTILIILCNRNDYLTIIQIISLCFHNNDILYKSAQLP